MVALLHDSAPTCGAFVTFSTRLLLGWRGVATLDAIVGFIKKLYGLKEFLIVTDRMIGCICLQFNGPTDYGPPAYRPCASPKT